MALADEVWERAKVLYENGHSLNGIAKKMAINCSNLAKKAKEAGWTRALKYDGNEELDNYKDEAEVLKEEKKNYSDETELIKIASAELIHFAKIGRRTIREGARNVQYKIFESALETIKSVNKFILDNPNGTYLRSDSAQGTTYGLTAEVLKPLAAIAAATAAITKDENVTINNTQVNNQQAMATLSAAPIHIEYIAK